MAYVFDPDKLALVVREVIGLPRKTMFDAITQQLAAAYPGDIYTGERKWMLNNAGGAMGQMFLLHASLKEYLLVFGSPIGTTGHSGRYRTAIWDFMLAGEMWCFNEGEHDVHVFKPGDAAFLGHRSAKGYRIREDSWMLEYSRGPIPTVLPFGLADTLFSTLDIRTATRTLVEYSKHVMRNLRPARLRATGAR